MVQLRMMNVTDLCSISTTAALHLPEKVKLLQCNIRHFNFFAFVFLKNDLKLQIN